MKHNYHSHTFRCNHAHGTEREYIEMALKNGLQTLGFSDHAPYIFGNDYVSRMRMRTDEITDYYTVLGLLREEYEASAAAGKTAPLDVRIGFEMEYYPDLFDRTLEYMEKSAVMLPSGKKAGLEYLILGQHHTKNAFDGTYAGWETGDVNVLSNYVDQAVKGMETGFFTYFAHPDLINFTGPEDVFRGYMKDMISAAEALDVPLEINLLGMFEEKHYPNRLFWELVADSKCRVVIGCDAHEPFHVGNPDWIARGEAFAASFGIKPVDGLVLKDPFGAV